MSDTIAPSIPDEQEPIPKSVTNADSGNRDSPPEPAVEAAGIKKMKKYDIKDIPHDSFFSEPVYLEKQFMLAAPEMPFSLEMKKALES